MRAITVGDEPVIRRVTGIQNPDEFATNAIRRMAWSPDGARLAVLVRPFASSRGFPWSNVFLYTVAADGSELRVLVREGPEGELVVEGEPAP